MRKAICIHSYKEP